MEPSKCTITINGSESTKTAKTTFYVFSHYTSLIKQPVDIEIHHKYELPLGAGYGSSGCGAIGSSFGLNYLLNVGLSYNQAGRIAHIAEVMNKTGLGTVGGQLTGGISITTKAVFRLSWIGYFVLRILKLCVVLLVLFLLNPLSVIPSINLALKKRVQEP